jgi:hypothetical protein
MVYQRITRVDISKGEGMKPMILNKEKQKIVLTPEDISDELYSALDDAFSTVLKDHGIDPSEICWDEWFLTATYS